MNIVSLDDARRQGLLRYFTGRPCKYGHVAERLTSNKTCMECAKDVQAAAYRRNAEAIKERVKSYRENNKSAVARRHRKYYDENRDRLSVYCAERYQRKKAEIAEQVRKYRDARPGFSREISSAYRARQNNAMPQWVDRQALREVYREAQRLTEQTGIQYSVDHIYPLKGANVCGLHVPWNLQVIPKIENCRKGRKMPDEWRRQKALAR